MTAAGRARVFLFAVPACVSTAPPPPTSCPTAPHCLHVYTQQTPASRAPRSLLLHSAGAKAAAKAKLEAKLAAAAKNSTREDEPPPTNGSQWTPKICPTPYDASQRDWASVIDACRWVGAYEKRTQNFFVRAAFHDSLSVDVTACASGVSRAACGGADASLLLNLEEQLRPENAYDSFSAITSRVLMQIAMAYDVSLAVRGGAAHASYAERPAAARVGACPLPPAHLLFPLTPTACAARLPTGHPGRVRRGRHGRAGRPRAGRLHRGGHPPGPLRLQHRLPARPAAARRHQRARLCRLL